MNLLIPTKKTFYIHSTYLIQYFYTSIMALCSFLRACLIHKMHRMWIFFFTIQHEIKEMHQLNSFQLFIIIIIFFLIFYLCAHYVTQESKSLRKLSCEYRKPTHDHLGIFFVNVVLNYFFLTPLHLELLFRQLMTMCAFYLSYSFLSSFPLEIKV